MQRFKILHLIAFSLQEHSVDAHFFFKLTSYSALLATLLESPCIRAYLTSKWVLGGWPLAIVNCVVYPVPIWLSLAEIVSRPSNTRKLSTTTTARIGQAYHTHLTIVSQFYDSLALHG
jgi:hypothetical protein